MIDDVENFNFYSHICTHTHTHTTNARPSSVECRSKLCARRVFEPGENARNNRRKILVDFPLPRIRIAERAMYTYTDTYTCCTCVYMCATVCAARTDSDGRMAKIRAFAPVCLCDEVDNFDPLGI